MLSSTVPPIRALVWDMGGVLIDWNAHNIFRSYFDNAAAIDAFLDEIEFTKWNIEQDRGRTFADAVIELSERFPQHAALIRAYDERWLESLSGPIQGTVELLEKLHRAGYPMYGLSNWSAEKFELTRALFPFLQWFRRIVVSGEVKLIKPDPRIYALLLEQTGCPANECLFIDDSAANIAAADALGFQTIRFESPEQLGDELKKLGLL